ncbi:MAG: hypothetical protein H7A24_13695 [Leptospiraceae bacterium]|nr:hypothetical protein [Leptospiraceae bacterium]MCP5512932.1 hypothetical protein [Leptospiraceae bacterium]
MDDYIEKFFQNHEEGHFVTHKYQITKDDYENYLNLFKDTSSVHTSAIYARERGFKDIVIHGSMINGILSNFTGTIFPGDRSFTQSTETQFKSPIYVGDELEVKCTLSQIVESVHVVILDFEIFNITQNKLSVEARIQSGIL